MRPSRASATPSRKAALGPPGLRAMTGPPSKMQILLARIAVALLIGLTVAGVLWYGLSTDELDRVWRNIVARPGGPMTFRFVLQPAMAAIASPARPAGHSSRRGRSLPADRPRRPPDATRLREHSGAAERPTPSSRIPVASRARCSTSHRTIRCSDRSASSSLGDLPFRASIPITTPQRKLKI